MEKDFESWFHHQHLDRGSPNLNSFKAPFDLGAQHTVPAYMNGCANVISTNGALPVPQFYGLPNSKASQLNEPCGWFYCLPRTCQAFAPMLNFLPKEKLPASVNENCGIDTNVGSGCAQKKFLVFDQSGDQTTVVFSSGIGTPVQCLTSWNPKPAEAYDLNKEEPGIKGETNYPSGPFLANNYHEDNHRDDVGSEMHEDTEELNALLYSDDDDDDYSEDDEETSTGHSPSTMITRDKQDSFQESDEEVASSAGPVKRQKLLDGAYNVSSLKSMAGSVKPYNSSEYEDDAESSCGDKKNQVLGESDSLSGNKRSRKEKIREMISILQTIIPGEKGKDSITVIDEAIHYLRSLKLKAKAYGLGSL